MSLISVTERYITTARKLDIDIFDFSSHKIVTIPAISKPEENDRICDINISSNSKFVAVITSVSKKIVLYELPITGNPKIFSLPRSASKLRFSVNNNLLFVADKTGDVFVYDLNINNDTGTKIMGYLSLLLDVLQSDDEKFLITCDRDEKIRISCYPNTYNIHSYCLGHKEFVNHIEFVPHNKRFLLSTSGDGTVKIWDYKNGKNCCTIDTNAEVDDSNERAKLLREIDAHALPIIHFATAQLDDRISIIAVSLYSHKKLFIYSIKTNKEENDFKCKMETKLSLEMFPTSVKFLKRKLLIYNDSDLSIKMYNITGNVDGTLSLDFNNEERVFSEVAPHIDTESSEAQKEYIKVLYKRKIDNVQEYQERKKQRISAKCNNIGI